jgi:hypothetical protein
MTPTQQQLVNKIEELRTLLIHNKPSPLEDWYDDALLLCDDLIQIAAPIEIIRVTP